MPVAQERRNRAVFRTSMRVNPKPLGPPRGVIVALIQGLSDYPPA